MGTITITTTAQQDIRLLAAFKDKMLLQVDPTQAQIKQWIVEQLKNVVLLHERTQAVNAIIIEDFTIT